MGYQLIETVEVGSGGASSIEFTGIPQDGVDLILVYSLCQNQAGPTGGLTIKVNGVSTNSYSYTSLEGSGSSAFSDSSSGTDGIDTLINRQATANTFNNGSTYISNYTTTGVKSISTDVVTEANQTAANQYLGASSTSGSAGSVTAPVASLTISQPATIIEHSTASLYKITAD